MSYGLLVVIMIAMAGCFGAAITFRIRAVGARASAMMMSRVTTIGDDGISELALNRIPPRRVAISPRARAMLTGAPFTAHVAALLDESGSPKTVAQFVAYTGGSALGISATCAILGFHTPASLFVGFFSATLPYFYFMHRRAKRITAFEAQLPQALELLALYLRSGRSLPQAFVAATDELTAPAGEEFSLCAEAYRLGRPLPAALRVMSDKYRDSVGLKLFSIAVGVMGQTGGNLVEVIDRIRKSMEASMMFTLKLRAMTGESRNSAVLLGVIPGLFMAASAMVMPEYFNMFFESVIGYCIFAGFCTIWVTGILWIRLLMSTRG